ncbi:MAG: tetratricopeptide repeat protein, partial [Chthoniobacterales bacterium]
LKVISRTSTQQYQSKPGNLSEIARQLGVAHILEGSVQKSNDSVRVNVQLIKADGDSHLWAETYDRKLTDIFAVESEVAQRIAGSLEARLTGREQQQLADVPTKDPHAYEAYLRGRTLLNVQGFQAIENAIGFLRKAVELDPQYAAAWAQLAMAESQRYGYERTPPQLELAKRAAETALRLQPELAEAHEGVGAYIYYCLHDFDRALAEMEEARSRSPNDAEVILYIGLLKRRQGKLEEAIEYQHKATVFDPRNSDIWVNLSGSYRGKRDFGNALSTIDQALAISPDELDIVGDKAEIYAAQGDLDSVDNVLRGHKIAPHTEARYQQTNALLCRRRFDDALAQYSAMENDVAQPALVLARRKGQLGQLQWFAGQPEQARQSLEEARRELIAIRDGGNTSDDLLAGLVLVDGFLADRPELEREADVFLKQTSRDKWQYGLSEQIVAAAYAVTGNADRALPLIEKALSISCDSSLTRANLRQHPVWDGVRNDPRFVKVMSDGAN